MTTAYINKISTVVPEHDIHDAFVEFADNSFTLRRKQLLFRRMADRAQISHRYSGISSVDDFYSGDPNGINTETRMIEFERTYQKLQLTIADGPVYGLAPLCCVRRPIRARPARQGLRDRTIVVIGKRDLPSV